MGADPTAVNLAVVDAHIRGEGRDPASAMALYTDDIVLEMPMRGLCLTGKREIQANYERMFAAMAGVEIAPGDRFATADRVVDDCAMGFRRAAPTRSSGRSCAPASIWTRRTPNTGRSCRSCLGRPTRA